MDYQEALTFIHSRPRLKKKPTLKRMQYFLAKLGHPEQKITAVHVAGTNGKGSTVAFLANMFHSQGLKVGTFTSPFITKFNERISVNMMPISDAEIVNLAEKIQPIVREMDQSYPDGGPLEFEIDTAMMFLYFKEHPVDIVIVEVGIGGLYDSTNVFTPILSVITNVGWDHMELLGDKLAKIAYQKAGIIKTKVPVVTGVKTVEALNVIKQQAQDQKAALSTINRDFSLHHQQFISEFGNLKDVQSGLLGVYQADNLAVSLESFFILKQILVFDFKPEPLIEAIRHTKWPGRMEIVQHNPQIILDGAHNQPGMEGLIASIKKYWPTQKVYVLAAILADKKFNTMLKELEALNQTQVVLTTFQNPAHRHVLTQHDLPNAIKAKLTYQPDWQVALQQIKQYAQKDDVIIITGSLYFISEVRATLK